jgi:hypothetical protein
MLSDEKWLTEGRRLAFQSSLRSKLKLWLGLESQHSSLATRRSYID